MLSDIANTSALERLQRARAKSRIKHSTWPDKHLIGNEGQPVPFHRAQELIWDSLSRTTAYVAGSQAGKSALTPWWLKREIEQRGGGDYLAVTSSFDLFKLKLLPQTLLVFESILGWGRYWAGDQIIELKDPGTGEFRAEKSTDPMWGRIILRSAQARGGLESATAKGAILDEAGQEEFTVEAWRAVLRRLSLNRGRILITTTLYGSGWLTNDVLQPAIQTGVTQTYDMPNGSSIDYTVSTAKDMTLVQADSIVNPEFPIEEYNAAKESMPPDIFAMFYRGRVSKPRHLIYDCFNEEMHVVPPFKIPADWQRYCGLDFGAVNTVATLWAEEPKSKKLYCYKEYRAGGRSAREHVEAMLQDEPMLPLTFGGAKAEGQWRQEFRDGGLSVKEPKVSDVWLGINICYAEIRANNLFFFSNCEGMIGDLQNYRRKYDNTGNPTDEIHEKNKYHGADGMRYLIASIRTRRNAMIAFA